MQPTSSTDSRFVPRKEFIKELRTPHNFSLLTVSGSSFVRLYSFPPAVIEALHNLFDNFYLTIAFRKDEAHSTCEFTLNQKPWASPKSDRTERILVDIISVIYKHGYSLLSTLDYGRENDDRIALAFSAPALPSNPILRNSPVPPGSGSTLSHQTNVKPDARVPFAISFVSATVLRVIYPPLNSTPAILQAVRGSWPRGIVSEKKIGDATYEFKLKGYKWFHEDTFASDSLTHILSLFSSLDSHACSMTASLSLGTRSRVKDLWLFTAPGTGDTADHAPDSPISHAGSHQEFRRSTLGQTPEPLYGSDEGVIPHSMHRRAPSAPQPSLSHALQSSTFAQPTRGESGALPAYTSGQTPAPPVGSVRKPAPRAQIPVSVNMDAQEDEPAYSYKEPPPDVVSNSANIVENMAGVGTHGRGKYGPGSNSMYTAAPAPKLEHSNDDMATSPKMGSTYKTHSQPPSLTSSSPNPRSHLSSPRHSTRPASSQSRSPPFTPPYSPPSNIQFMSNTPPQLPDVSPDASQPLLSPGMFADKGRDSAFSSQTEDTSTDWSGTKSNIQNGNRNGRESSLARRTTSPAPVLPGGWVKTPDDEEMEPNSLHAHSGNAAQQAVGEGVNIQQGRSPQRSLHDVDARVRSPELVHDHDNAQRKSEAGLVGVIPPRSQTPSPAVASSPTKDTSGKDGAPLGSPTKSRGAKGNGWVLVNVEGKSTPEDSNTQQNAASKENTSVGPKDVREGASMSPAAKAIVMIDAKEAKEAREAKAKAKSGSGLRRLLSFSRSDKNADSNKANRPDSPPTEKGGRSPRSPPNKLRSRLARLSGSDQYKAAGSR